MRGRAAWFLVLGVAAGAALVWLLGRESQPDGAGPDARPSPAAPSPASAAASSTTGAAAPEPDRAAGRAAIVPAATVRGRGDLRVVVALEDRSPLPNVAVHVSALDGRQVSFTKQLVVTGEDGVAAFAGLDAGPWRIVLDRNLEAEVQVRAGEPTEHRFVVPRGATALARVVDAHAQRIAGATVTLWPAGGILDAPAVSAGAGVGTTDANGELLLRGLPQNGAVGCWLAAHHPAFGWSPSRMVAAARDEQDTATRVLELRIAPGGAFVTVRVEDEAPQPVPQASVELLPVDRTDSRADGDSRVLAQLLRSGSTDQRGAAVLGPLAPGEYRLTVVAAGYESFRAPLHLLDEQPLERGVVLRAEARVRARIVATDGTAVRGVDFQVQAEPRGGRVTSGPDGSCEVGCLSPGNGTFVATHPLFQQARGAVELMRGVTAELEVTLLPLPAIRGRLVDEADQPLAGLGVAAAARLPADETDQRRATSAADGSFTMPARVGLDYRLQVFEPGTAIPLPGTEPAVVRSRDEPWPVRVPRTSRATAFVDGMLVDGEGRPAIAGRHLAVRGDGFTVSAGHTMPAPTTHSATGRIRLAPLPPGSNAQAFGGQPSFTVPGVVLHPDATTQLGQVIVPAAGTLRVEVTAAPGLQVKDLMVQADGVGESEVFRVDGTAGSWLLLPGRWHVVVYGTGFRWLEQDLELAAGAVARVSGELRPAVRVGLRFWMPADEHGAAFTIRDAAGAVACTHELADGVASEDLWPFFEPGTFEVAIRGSSGRNYRTQFQVRSLERSDAVHELRGEAVR